MIFEKQRIGHLPRHGHVNNMKTMLILATLTVILVACAPAAAADDPDGPVIIGDSNEDGTCIRYVPDQMPPVQINPDACVPP